MPVRNYLWKNVVEAANERIERTFDNFEKICISFSGWKDSTVMLHLVMEECKKRNQKIWLLFIDWECQFNLTIDHIKHLVEQYKDYIDLYWVQLPILTNNATSMYEPVWKSWDESKKWLWIREKFDFSIQDHKYFPFYYDGITFEEFVPLFGKRYSQWKDMAQFVGIRTTESLNRYRACSTADKWMFKDKRFTTKVVDTVYNVYPIYDFTVEDIRSYLGKYKKQYNKLYDRMHKAWLSVSQMRVDEPFGDEARKNLRLYSIIEPETWAKFIARMNWINTGALYSKTKGNILWNHSVTLPEWHTRESFAKSILNSIPPKTAEHYKNKIAKYIFWYKERGYPDWIPDAWDYKLEQLGKIPSRRQVCKTLLRNDYRCRGLWFGITKNSNYQKYLDLMRRKREERWILSTAK